ncbi:MAG TPA: NAD-dependent epimerase/dehydratase family protein [Gemmatimonadales bacterium]|nr:NAD-dependent epimerase/dehydratase family protein [Gemmatimonadales bacterium]
MESLEHLLDTDLEYLCANAREAFGRMEGKRLLLTGGAGFLGYYLVLAVRHWNRHHARAPIALEVWDNFIRGRPEWLTALAGEPHLAVRTVDLIRPLPADMGDVQFVIHAAGIASPTYYRRYPIETMDANINGLRALLDYSRARQAAPDPVEGFLFFSSSEIYGDPPADKIPTSEDYRGNVSCTGPRACYDESKRYGETLCVNFARQHGVPVRCARPFNNYGPGLKITDRRLLPDFARDVFAGRDIVMLSDGSPTRTFCYSADSIMGYYKVLVQGRAGEAYNIGIDRPEISVAEVAEKVVALARDLIGYQGKVVRGAAQEKDYLVDNPARRCPRIDKARSELDYHPTVLVDEGLRRAMVWYSYHRTAEDA